MKLKGVTDQQGTLDDYCEALSEFGNDAIWNVVSALRSGKIEDASLEWSPSAPKLATYVRAEQRRIEILNAPKPIPYRAVEHSFIDRRVIQRQKVDALQAEGWRLVAENIGIDEWETGGKRRRWKVGTTWFWALQEAWQPPQAQDVQGVAR